MSPVETLKHAAEGRGVSDTGRNLGKGYTSVPWTTRGSGQGTNGRIGRIDAPQKFTVRNEDSLYQRRSVMGTIRTRCVNAIAYLGQ